MSPRPTANAPPLPKPKRGAGNKERRKNLNMFFLPEPLEGSPNLIKLYLGDYRVSRAPTVVFETMLSLCVSVCLRDRVNHVSGMCHYLIPACSDEKPPSERQLGRYGENVLLRMLQEIMAAGANPERLEGKLFGGASVHPQLAKLARDNIACATRFLHAQAIPLLSSDIGGEYPRHLQFRAADGVVRIRKLKRTADFAIAQAEQTIAHALGCRIEENGI